MGYGSTSFNVQSPTSNMRSTNVSRCAAVVWLNMMLALSML
jgi:hypothetical protein